MRTWTLVAVKGSSDYIDPVLVFILLACDRSPPGDFPLPEELEPRRGEFLVAVIPDTQIYAMSYPETFDAQMRWIAQWSEAYDIVFVTHVGDIVQHGDSEEQWEVARAAYDWLEDIGLPHGFSAGGHDFWVGGSEHDSSCSVFDHMDCDMVDFINNVGPQHYEDQEWWAGSSPSGRSSAQLITAEGMDLLFLHLPQDTPLQEVEWAHEVLDAHPGALAHLTTHRYLFDYRLTDALPSPLDLLPAGRFNSATYLLGDQSLVFHDSPSADELFEDLVATHPNIWGVHCGHVDSEYWQDATNSAGLPVYEVLVDFQNMADGGGGWLRLLKFSPKENTVTAFTFSPTTGKVRENGAGYWHSIEILESYKDAAEETLISLGADMEELEALLEAAKVEGSPEQQEYYESLYGDGERDSTFIMDVDFQAYIDASL